MDDPIALAQKTADNKEKNWAALSSVLAAIFLTSIKIVVGLLTGSLGIMAEAAHSGLDLLAAGVTYVAVKISGRPADANHNYGHGKVENLSALFETLLLLITCVWIIYEAINRLFFKEVEVEVTIWSFLVMAVSIIVDFSRSRMLSRVAKKFDSQALEADALHFSTDIWSSAVVIGGLAFILVSDYFHIPWLAKADSIAALFVAGIVVFVSIELGRRAIGELLDEVSATLQEKIKNAAQVSGVEEVNQVRVRHSGPEYFVDLTIAVSRTATSSQAHQIAERVEEAIHLILPNSNVMIHIDPVRAEDELLTESLKVLGAQVGLGVHNVRMHIEADHKILTMHLDVEEKMPLEDAYAKTKMFENLVAREFPEFTRFDTHLEPVYRTVNSDTQVGDNPNKVIQSTVSELPKTMGIECSIHKVNIVDERGSINISFHCLLNGSLPIIKAHEITERLEISLRHQIPNLGRVVIHMEPYE